jgi:hypothetical protein
MITEGDMHECLYDYLIVEYMEPGIHPHVWGNQWFRWNVALRTWEFTNKDDVPPHLNVSNWALG